MENNQFIIAVNSLITQEKRGSILFETRLPFFFFTSRKRLYEVSASFCEKFVKRLIKF